MLISVVVTLCLVTDPNACVDKVITDQATGFECGASGPQFIAGWMGENGYTDRGYYLAKWGCTPGGRRKVHA